jgi:hydrogenase expression/formation protein HypC
MSVEQSAPEQATSAQSTSAQSTSAQATSAQAARVVPECIGEVCITCSDTAVEVTVLRLLPDEMAAVDTGAGEETVSIALVTASVGDTILVHAREAIAVVGR